VPRAQGEVTLLISLRALSLLQISQTLVKRPVWATLQRGTIEPAHCSAVDRSCVAGQGGEAAPRRHSGQIDKLSNRLSTDH